MWPKNRQYIMGPFWQIMLVRRHWMDGF